MEKENKKLILVFFLAILIMVNFVSAQVRVEECVENNQCNNNEICINWKCQQASTIFIDEESGSKIIENNQSITSESNSQNNSVNSALIIAIGIIVGLAVLGLLIRRRNK